MAAERITIASPVWTPDEHDDEEQGVTSGSTASHGTGWPPNAVTIALRRPIWSPCR